MGESYRALVVDDDAEIRELMRRSLCREGFQCEEAEDGAAATEAAKRSRFDVVVTDLRMPRRNGHSLVVELLSGQERPLVVVLTGVLEPRLTQDLMCRGVDDVMFKPVDCGLLASKIKGLLERRRLRAIQPPAAEKTGVAALGEADRDDGPVTLAVLKEKLADFGRILPISAVAVELAKLTTSPDYDARKAAQVLLRDPALVADVFRTANSPCFNSSGRKISNLEEAMVRLGQKRVGELAVAAKALDALTANVLPWMDVRLCWRSSLGAGAALKQLLPQSGLSESEGLYLGALLHPVGRIVLGTLFPRRYARMVEECRSQQAALQDLEKREFPETHAEIAARLLARWNLPAEAIEPLRYVCRPYAVLGELYQPLRTKVELLKLAILFGQLAAGRLEPWELVEAPPPGLLSRWKAEELAQVIARACIEIKEHAEPNWASQQQAEPATATSRTLKYRNHSGARFDFVEAIAASVGFACEDPDIRPQEQPVVVNCIGAIAPLQLAAGSQSTILAARHEAARFEGLGHVVAVPLSCAALQHAFEQASICEDSDDDENQIAGE